MMERKTYGVYGILEWHTIFNVGKTKLRVSFEGGSVSGYGVTPARFTTTNRVMQHIIESSSDYKKGKIKLLHAKTVLKEEPVQSLRQLTKNSVNKKR